MRSYVKLSLVVEVDSGAPYSDFICGRMLMYQTQKVSSGMKTGKAVRLGRPMMSKGLKCTMRSVTTTSAGCLMPRMVP